MKRFLAIFAAIVILATACLAPAPAEPTAQPTAAPTTAPAAPTAAPPKTDQPPGSGGFAVCPPAQEIWGELGGINAIAIGQPNGDPLKNDRCVFNWNSNVDGDSGGTPRVIERNCPDGWMCTANVKGDPITKVHVGPSGMRFTAVTYRLIRYKGRLVYDPNNPLAKPCELLVNENQYFKDQKQDILGWRAEPVGFNCPGIQPVPQQQGAAAPPVSAKPQASSPAANGTTGNSLCVQVNQAWLAANIGGTASLWEAKNPGDWEYMGKGKGRVDFRYPGWGQLDSWQGRDVSKGAGTPKGTLVASNDQATWHSGCRYALHER